MSTDNFDKEINQLYQQRKKQLVAPEIDVSSSICDTSGVTSGVSADVIPNAVPNVSTHNKQQPATRQNSLLRMMAIFIAGGAVSFGIMAVISHLINNPVKHNDLTSTGHQIEITKVVPEKVVQKIIPVKQALPPKPINTPSKPEQGLSIEQHNENTTINELNLNVDTVQVVTLPELNEPALSVSPTFKVMPKYSINASQVTQPGKIKLRYQIDVNGKVNNISIVESSVNRDLQKSAKLALSKWQYKPGQAYKDKYEIVFEFKSDDE